MNAAIPNFELQGEGCHLLPHALSQLHFTCEESFVLAVCDGEHENYWSQAGPRISIQDLCAKIHQLLRLEVIGQSVLLQLEDDEGRGLSSGQPVQLRAELSQD